MARPRIPTEVKRSRGTLQKCREKNEMSPPRGRPIAPDGFSIDELIMWNKTCELLDEAKVLAGADTFALEMFCVAICEFRELRRLIARNGRTQIATNSFGSMMRANPEVAMLADTERRIAIWLSKLGLTPADRARVSAAPTPDDTSGAFAAYT